MRTGDFDYSLPSELIAAHPAPRRDASRLMVLGRETGAIEHRTFSDLSSLLEPGDCLVLNDSRVIPARLFGRRETGARVEVLLLHPESDGLWRALVRPAKKLPPGTAIRLEPDGPAEPGGPAEPDGLSEPGGLSEPDEPSEPPVLRIEQALPGGERLIRIESDLDAETLMERYGHVPLPPYIVAARKDRAAKARESGDSGESGESGDSGEPAHGDSELEQRDRERYQTVYARHTGQVGSVAAPTAGLHFTPELLQSIESRGIEVRRVTLHVGPGTFAPVKVDDPRRHAMHHERFKIDGEEARAITAAIRDPDRRVIAVGTTVTRVLESCMQSHGALPAAEAATDLLILPGFRFRAVDALLTNFHLPRSTLLMLVSAFADRDRILGAYREAVEQSYRFYSYGDAMLIR